MRGKRTKDEEEKRRNRSYLSMSSPSMWRDRRLRKKLWYNSGAERKSVFVLCCRGGKKRNNSQAGMSPERGTCCGGDSLRCMYTRYTRGNVVGCSDLRERESMVSVQIDWCSSSVRQTLQWAFAEARRGASGDRSIHASPFLLSLYLSFLFVISPQ